MYALKKKNTVFRPCFYKLYVFNKAFTTLLTSSKSLYTIKLPIYKKNMYILYYINFCKLSIYTYFYVK